MMRISGNSKTTLMLICAAALSACAPAPPPAAPDTRAADEAAIRKTDADWSKAAETGKVEAWMAFYTDDIVALPPNEKAALTREDVNKSIAAMFALPEMKISWTADKVEVAKSGELAYLRGNWKMSFKGPKGKTVEDHGKMIEVFKKQADGSWKCAVDIWNSDLPATSN